MSGLTESTPLLGRASLVRPQMFWRAGAILVTLGMVAGAFGSHGLRKKSGITPDQIQAWGTASNYTVFNGLGLMLVSMHPRFATHRFAGPAIAIGSVVFSGTIFALVLARDRFKWLGPVTPLGGSFMMAGFLSLAF
ncbi:uncharacterized protein PHACADRAFT_247669 [Phanerochaete carnosa HHB-10118-sp]|uniref:DUF423-domain-containing protein n=1 Tax=Phanerochaete carnosa (strain HHB-10118-sp) TaxID=650164 RepID=K5WPN6_PHACS|nr:uncharacterized protein PHACADRAFT_247669 [Phanerochaete carnosa HHB-10118-sp]EKM61209.1 hypothetical protein PHACADRAFT_247669 [Phanerochaete carnosa HHB-10118-sp]